MDWETIRQWAKHYYPDLDATWDDPEARAYYWRQWCRTLRRKAA